MKRVTKREIVSTLRTFDATKICALYKKIHGEVPTERSFEVPSAIRLNPHAINKWAACYATSRRMERKLFALFLSCRHCWRRTIDDEKSAHSKHGNYVPLPRQAAHDFFEYEKKRGIDNYTKVAMYGHTFLYACSPVFGHTDYNRSRILEIKGNERFCELLIKKYGSASCMQS